MRSYCVPLIVKAGGHTQMVLSGNLGGIGAGVASGAQSDRSRNLQTYQMKLQMQQRDAAAKWAATMGHPEWAPAAEAGGLSIGDMFSATRPVAVSGDGYLAKDGSKIANARSEETKPA